MANRNRLTAAMVVLAVFTVFALTVWVVPLEGIVGVAAGLVMYLVIHVNARKKTTAR